MGIRSSAPTELSYGCNCATSRIWRSPPKHPDKAEHAADRAFLPSDFNLEMFLFFCARFCKLTIPV